MPETQQADRHAAMGLSGEGSGEPECQQRLANLLANLPGIAYRCANDERWTMEFLSDGCIDVTGYSPHELIGNRTPSFYDLIRPDYRGLLRDRVGEALAERRSFEFEYPISTKSGEQKWVWERGFGVIGADGELVGLEGFITDITARKQTQEQLQRSEERLRNMVEHLPAGAVFRDEDTLILNQAAEQITGYSRTELAHVDDWFRTLYGDLQQERRALYEASRTSGFPTRRLLPITRKDGKRRYVEFAAYAYDRGEVWLLHDVTELKAAENELRSYQDQLRSLASALSLAEDRERRRIAAELHDGPGQTLSMAHVKLVSIRDAQTTPESASTLEEARRMIDQAIRDIRTLTFSLSSPVLQHMGLVPAIQQLCGDLSALYGGRFTVEGHPEIKGLTGERQMILFRCVRELLINIGKHAEAEEATVRLSSDEDLLRIVVEDNGIGFDAAQVGRGFSPSGGFGLFGMHECLTHLGGSLQIRSALGQGTSVRIEFPHKDDRATYPDCEGSDSDA